jgi:DNA-binding GntR family transcriptional regulator
MPDTIHNSPSGNSVETTYQIIREQILSSELKGGQWLRESDLAAVVGVSRTPVREALRRLTAEGLVLYQRNRGVQVQSWSRKDFDDVFGVRLALEPWGCSLAAANGNADIDELDRLARAMDDEGAKSNPGMRVITELNNTFHGEILKASGNDLLCSLTSTVIQVPLVHRTFSHYTRANLERSLIHHHELVDALRVGRGDWAASVMRSHLHAAWTVLRERTQNVDDVTILGHESH